MSGDWSSDVCSSDLKLKMLGPKGVITVNGSKQMALVVLALMIINKELYMHIPLQIHAMLKSNADVEDEKCVSHSKFMYLLNSKHQIRVFFCRFNQDQNYTSHSKFMVL